MEEIDLKEIVHKNQEMLTSVDKRLRKIEKHFRTEAILNWIKWLIVVVPIVFGLIYISPYVKSYARMLQPALQALKLDQLNAILGNNEDSNAKAPAVNNFENLCDPVQRQALVDQYCK